MQKIITHTITLIALVAFILSAGWLLWYLFAEANQLLIGMFAGLVPSIITIMIHINNQKKEHKNWLLRNKNAFLIEIIDMVTTAPHSNGAIDMVKQIKLIQPALIAHGSKDLLKAWEDMQKMSEETDMSKMLVRSEKFLRALRKELGHDDSAMPPGYIFTAITKPDGKEEILKHFRGAKHN